MKLTDITQKLKNEIIMERNAVISDKGMLKSRYHSIALEAEKRAYEEGASCAVWIAHTAEEIMVLEARIANHEQHISDLERMLEIISTEEMMEVEEYET